MNSRINPINKFRETWNSHHCIRHARVIYIKLFPVQVFNPILYAVNMQLNHIKKQSTIVPTTDLTNLDLIQKEMESNSHQVLSALSVSIKNLIDFAPNKNHNTNQAHITHKQQG